MNISRILRNFVGNWSYLFHVCNAKESFRSVCIIRLHVAPQQGKTEGIVGTQWKVHVFLSQPNSGFSYQWWRIHYMVMRNCNTVTELYEIIPLHFKKCLSPWVVWCTRSRRRWFRRCRIHATCPRCRIPYRWCTMLRFLTSFPVHLGWRYSWKGFIGRYVGQYARRSSFKC